MKNKNKKIKIEKYKGSVNYLSGEFYGKKIAGGKCIFRSSYELAYFMILEEDEDVLIYYSEKLNIPYKIGSKNRIYKPDLFVIYKNGKSEVQEIKPYCMVKDLEVQYKAKAAVKYLEKRYPDTKYKFITEKDIFEDETSYRKFVKTMEG